MLRPMRTPNSSPILARELLHDAEEFLKYLGSARGYSPLTLRAYRSDFLQFSKYLEHRGLPTDFTQLSVSTLYGWATHLGEQYAPATVRRKLDSLSSLLTHLRNLGVIDSNPLATVPRPKRTRRIPDPPSTKECQQLLAACQTARERVILALLLFAGLRKSELIGLDHSGLDEDLSEVRIRNGKGGHQRVIPLHNTVRDAMAEYLGEHGRREGPLIISRAETRLGSTSFQRLFRRVVKRAGLEERGLTIHSLRHAFASQLVKAGVDVATVAELMGHSNISTTSAYLHSNAATKQDAIAKLCIPEKGGGPFETANEQTCRATRERFDCDEEVGG